MNFDYANLGLTLGARHTASARRSREAMARQIAFGPWLPERYGMPYFSEQVDALLRVFLSSPTWHIDRPRGNARFYRFAAVLMQEVGQPDIREVRATLEEAARAWAADYEAEGGSARIDTLCERLQVLYDFFGALQNATPPTPSGDAPLRPPHAPPPHGTLPPRQEPPAAPAAPPRVTWEVLARGSTAPQKRDRAPQERDAGQPPIPRKARNKRGARAQVEPLETGTGSTPDSLSSGHWKQFWREVIRLHGLLVQRRGEPPLPTTPRHDSEAIGAEMRRWMGEVLRAEEITGAEKRDLIGKVIAKVTLGSNETDGSPVTIEWLK